MNASRPVPPDAAGRLPPRRLERGGARRHPADLLRIGLGAAGFAVATGLALRSDVSVLERDVFRLVNDLPAIVEPLLVVVMQAGTIGFGVGVAVVAAALRRRQAGRDVAFAAIGAWLLAKLFKAIVGRPRPALLLAGTLVRDSSGGLGFPSGHAAVAAAIAGAVSPYVSRPYRRAMWSTVVLVGLARMYVGVHLPLDAVAGWLLGWAVASLVHVAFGSPSWVVTREAVFAGLRSIGVSPVAAAEPALDARGSTPWVVEDAGGRRLFVKALSRDQRDADWLYKAARYLLLRGPEDESPFATPKQQLEHEAYVAMLARRSGARVPDVLEVVSIDPRDALVAMEAIDGVDLASDPERLDDAVLDRLWGDVARLQVHRIAHRDLRAANVVVDRGGQPWIVDFGFAEASASPERLARDVAELLASTAAIVGAGRAAAPAVTHVDPGVLELTPQQLQRPVLSRATRHAVAAHPDLLGELREAVSRAAGIEPPTELEPVLRVRLRSVLLLLVAAFALHVLLPLVGEVPRIVDALRTVRLDWLALVVAASAVTYLGAAMGLVAACPIRLPYVRTVALTLASSFTNRLAPGGLGRIGLDVRYFMRHGASRAVAVATESLNVAGTATVHVTAAIVATAAFGGTALRTFRFPSEVVVVVVVAGALAALGVVLVIGPWRRAVTSSLREAWTALRDEAQQPARLVQLLAGGVLLNLGYVVALYASLRATGVGPAIGTVTLVYLGADAVAAASPTPGGLGAAEAAYVAALTATGVAASAAVAAVLVFRLLTFWAPTLVGWFSFRWLRRHGYA